jgi:hypothetical protein
MAGFVKFIGWILVVPGGLLLALFIASMVRTAACDETTTDCSVAPGMYRFEEVVESGLKDPDSAEFRNQVIHKLKTETGETYYAMCGEVNARNGFGAYAGFQRVIATGMPLMDDGGDVFQGMWEKVCSSSSRI